MKDPTGGPAFPALTRTNPATMPEKNPATPFQGDIRDWFAGQALAGIMARPQQPVDCRHVDIDRIGEYLEQHKINTAREAIKEAMLVADEAIAAREKGTQ